MTNSYVHNAYNLGAYVHDALYVPSIVYWKHLKSTRYWFLLWKFEVKLGEERNINLKNKGPKKNKENESYPAFIVGSREGDGKGDLN